MNYKKETFFHQINTLKRIYNGRKLVKIFKISFKMSNYLLIQHTEYLNKRERPLSKKISFQLCEVWEIFTILTNKLKDKVMSWELIKKNTKMKI